MTPYDARHTIQCICHIGRHLPASSIIQLHIHEEEPEALARHLLLLGILLDSSLTAKDRLQTLLEVHGNALVRQRTSEYIEERGRAIESLLVDLGSGSSAREAAAMRSKAGDEAGACLASILDVSMLKFQDRDRIVESLQKYRRQTEYDMVKAWDTRSRKLYGDRYDFRRNMIDWDYHMRLMACGTPFPGLDPNLGSIVHFHHFRHWRMHGVAYELRDSNYSHANRTMLTTAYGRTKEFKDGRSGKDVGRSVSAFGFWGDIQNSPYVTFGILCPQEPSLYAAANKQFTRTAVDIAEHNLMSWMDELRTGRRYEPASSRGGEAHRAKVARGPTSMADLEAESSKEGGQGAVANGVKANGVKANGVKANGVKTEELETVPEGEEGAQGEEGGEGTAPESSEEVEDVDKGRSFEPCLSYDGPRKGWIFKQGSSGVGYYSDGDASSVGAGARDPSGSNAEAVAVKVADVHTSSLGKVEEVVEKVVEEVEDPEKKLREEEEALDRAARLVISSSISLSLTMGADIVKSLTGRSKVHGSFDLISLGHRHMHLAGPDHLLQKVAKDESWMVVETAKYMLQLKKEQADLFSSKINEICESAGETMELRVYYTLLNLD